MELEEANSQRESPAKFIGSMAEKLGAVARAATVFGEPVARDGVTVIPVARARWGFGGGIGHKNNEDGAGGGGGVQVSPIGFIEMKNGGAEFRPIRTLSLPWMIAGCLASTFIIRQILRPASRK